MKASPHGIHEWRDLAEKRLRTILARASGETGLRKLGPWRKAPRWTAEVKLMGPVAMTRLNGRYRGKRYATDVLSFPSPEVFGQAGHLGELVICLAVLKRQARELGHSPEHELEVLLAHGVLHLLGLDHELGAREAARMARWERRLLPARVAGLIRRSC